MQLFTSLSRRILAGLIASLSLCALAYADTPDGTYRLVMRKLTDGTVYSAGGAGNGHLQEWGVSAHRVLAHPGRKAGLLGLAFEMGMVRNRGRR